MNQRESDILDKYFEEQGRPNYGSASVSQVGAGGCLKAERFLHRCAGCFRVHQCEYPEAKEGRLDRARCDVIFAREQLVEAQLHFEKTKHIARLLEDNRE